MNTQQNSYYVNRANPTPMLHTWTDLHTNTPIDFTTRNDLKPLPRTLHHSDNATLKKTEKPKIKRNRKIRQYRPKPCESCGKLFTKRANEMVASFNSRRFCGPECRLEGQRKAGLDMAAIKQILNLKFQQRMTLLDISKRMGLTPGMVHRVVKGKGIYAQLVKQARHELTQAMDKTGVYHDA